MNLTEAIVSLRPGVPFVLRGDDIEGIEWHAEGVEPLTLTEVQAEADRLEADKAAKRQATIDKLEALGLTLDDLAALTQ